MAKVMLMSLGSRGDMEPFLAKAEILLEEGHEVALCMPDNSKAWRPRCLRGGLGWTVPFGFDRKP